MKFHLMGVVEMADKTLIQYVSIGPMILQQTQNHEI